MAQPVQQLLFAVPVQFDLEAYLEVSGIAKDERKEARGAHSVVETRNVRAFAQFGDPR